MPVRLIYPCTALPFERFEFIMTSICQRGERVVFDVLVLGSGLAGLSFCLELLKLRPQTRIAVISKTSLHESNSYYAQGGIAAVHAPGDSVQQHINDTLTAGDGLSHATAVQKIIGEGPRFIQQLKTQGIQFDANTSGQPDLAREGGHSERRIFHCGDQTGRALIDVLTQRLHEQPNVTMFEQHMGVKLLTRIKKHQPGDGGEVVGAYILDTANGKIHTFLANVVVLATGGAGKTYRYTTNPDVATGDGVAMAYRAGARVGNMEFYQFHPTLLYHRHVHNFLISEAVRGEGGYLRLADNGERFMRAMRQKPWNWRREMWSPGPFLLKLRTVLTTMYIWILPTDREHF